ncbi:MAG: hypothetical protein V3S64_04490 [bacterium]
MKNTGQPGSHTILKFDEYSGSDTPMAECAENFLDAAPVLILDVEGLNFDSRLIGELINLHRSFSAVWKDQPHRLALVNLTEFSVMVFDQVKLSHIIHRYKSVAEVLADS